MNQTKNERVLIGNPEDIRSLKIMEILDTYEVSLTETYHSVVVYPIIPIRVKR